MATLVFMIHLAEVKRWHGYVLTSLTRQHQSITRRTRPLALTERSRSFIHYGDHSAPAKLSDWVQVRGEWVACWSFLVFLRRWYQGMSSVQQMCLHSRRASSCS